MIHTPQTFSAKYESYIQRQPFIFLLYFAPDKECKIHRKRESFLELHDLPRGTKIPNFGFILLL